MKHIKTFFACLLMAVLSIGQVWAENASFAPSDFSGQGTSGTGSAISATNSTVTFACNKGYGTTQFRCYNGGKITISSANTITAISFTFSGSYTGGLSTSYTDLSTNSWEQTLSSQARITACTVTYTPAAPSYTITAESNNTTYGTVSLSGSVITGSPKSGYRYASPAYTVSPANSATVSQSNNAFTVTPSANTTVTINFEEIPTYTLKYHDGSGDGSKNNIIEGTNLITALGTPAASCDATSTTFVGWTTTEISTKTDTKPTFVAANTVVNSTTAAVTYYAVYAKSSTGSWSITSIDKINSGSNGYAAYDGSHTASNISYTSSNVMPNSGIQFKTNSGYIYNTTVMSSDIKSIVITSASTNWNVYTSNSSISSTPSSGAITISSDGNTRTFTVSSTGHKYFHIKGGANTPVASSIQVNYGTTKEYVTTCCTPLAQINGSVSSTTQTSAVLKWKALSDQVSAWAVSYKEKGTSDEFASVTTSEKTTETVSSVVYNKWTISNLGAGKTYQFKITATFKSGVCTDENDFIVEGATESNYTITEATNDNTKGTVTRNGNVITGSPAQNCRYANPAYSVSPANSATVEQNGNDFTVTPSANTTVTINFEAIPSHKVTFSANGNETNENVMEDADITFPTTASGCAGKVFCGWVTAANRIDGETNTEPTYVTSAKMGTSDVTYYAVFAKETKGELTTKNDELTRATTGVSNGATSYTAWSNRTATNGSGAVYAGNSAGSNNAIQLRSSDNSGIITTTTGNGKATKVTISWNSNTISGRTVDVYGKNTAYTATSDLYENNKGTKIGSIVKGTSTAITITDSYDYIGLRSSSGAMYLDKVTIEWTANAPSTYSKYATSCTPQANSPVFSHTSGSEFIEATDIAIITGQTGATIYYTMTSDGSTPADPDTNDESQIYSDAITLNASGTYTFKAIAAKEGFDDSEIVTATYTVDIPLTLSEFLSTKPTTNKKVDLTGAIIWGQKSDEGLIFIQKGNAAVALYKFNNDKTDWLYGKKIDGYVTGKYSLYHAMPELSISNFEEATVVDASESDYPDALVVTDNNSEEAMVVDNAFRMIKMENVTFGKDDYDYVTITSAGENTYYYEDVFDVLKEALPNSATSCTVTGLLYPWYSDKDNYGYDQLAPLTIDAISTGSPKASAILPTVSEASGAVAKDKVVVITPQEGMTTTLKIGDASAQTITTATNVTIDADKSIVVTAANYYYTDNSKTYTYTVDESLTERAITIDNTIANGTVSADKASAAQNATITLTPNPQPNYHLASWSVFETETPANTITVTNNQFTMPAAAVTVSATFAEDNYATVQFNGNGATGGSVSDQKVYVNKNLTLPACGYTKSGYSFAGWKIGETTYNVGDTYSITSSGTIIFTAQWEAYPWAANGKWELVTDASSLAANDYIIIASASVENALGTKNDKYRNAVEITRTSNKSSITSIGDATVLQLKAGTANNSFAFLDVVANNYLATSSSTNNDMGISTTIVANASWNISLDGENIATVTANGTYTHNHLRANNSPARYSCYLSTSTCPKVMLYRFVSGSFYNINYAKGVESGEEDKVSNMPSAQVTANDGTATLANKEPIYVGFIFNGWKDQDNNDYQPGDDVTLTKNVTLTAQWTEAPTYTLSYDKNGGEGTIPSATNYYPNAEVTLAGALEKEGLLFAGWEYDGNVYAAGATFTMPATSVTMKARFVNGAIYSNIGKVDNVWTIQGVGAPQGTTVVYNQTYNTKEQITVNNSMTLTLSGYDPYTIKGVTLSMKSNTSKGAGTLSVKIGNTTVATHENANVWYGASHHTTNYEDIHISMSPTRVMAGEDIVIKIEANESSLYCQSFTIEYEVVRDEILEVVPGTIGTYCPKKTVKFPAGATFYAMAYVKMVNDVPYKVYFDELAEDESLIAGHPYFYIADDDVIMGIKVGDAATAGINDKGLIGKVDEYLFQVSESEGNQNSIFVVYQNSIKRCGDGWFRLGAEKAYIDLRANGLITNEENAPQPAPGRRRASISNAEAPQVATGLDALSDDSKTMKVIIDNQLFIIRNGKMYDTTGRLVENY